jgi:hypothetical protein
MGVTAQHATDKDRIAELEAENALLKLRLKRALEALSAARYGFVADLIMESE